MKPVVDHHHGLHSPTPASATKISLPISSGEAALLGKGRYKAWALVAIALLALWSMFAASVTLRWSSGELAAPFGDASDPLIDELDPLEMEQREKTVRRMWDVYTRTGDHVRLPRFWQEAFEAAYEELAGVDVGCLHTHGRSCTASRFWQEAFEAAYEELAGDDTQASDAAISEIARMSVHRPEVEQSWNRN